MIRLLASVVLGLALALVAALAVAQAPPACLPGVYGDQYPGTYVHGPLRGDKGWYGWGWCKAADGSPYAVYRLCAHGQCVSDLGAYAGRQMVDLGLQVLASDPKSVYGGWWVANPPSYHCGDGGAQVTAPSTPQGLACAELNALLAKDRPAYTPPPVEPPPPPPRVYVWKVKANGLSTTRPVYTLTNGVRGTTALGVRATVGQPCDELRPTLASGSDLWAEFGPSFAPGQVALCAK